MTTFDGFCVRLWHKADTLNAPTNVRFEGNNGHDAVVTQCLLLIEADIEKRKVGRRRLERHGCLGPGGVCLDGVAEAPVVERKCDLCLNNKGRRLKPTPSAQGSPLC